MEQVELKQGQTEAASAGQFLTFALGSEAYGIELLKVQEIKGYSPITPIPGTPAHVKGVMNLRGTVIPVVDLRIRFGMETIEYTQFNVIIVVNVGAKVMGLLVDAVSDVLSAREGEVRPAPDFGAQADTRFISGMASSGDNIAVLLNIDRLLNDDDLAATETAAGVTNELPATEPAASAAGL
jgi:purine-binding chemotaxis protein CheW